MSWGQGAQPLGRRQLLRGAALGAAGLGRAGTGLGAVLGLVPARAGAGALPRRAHQGLPVLPARAYIASSNGAQVFRSRPDLRPPTVTIVKPPEAGVAPGLVVTEAHGSGAQQGPLIFDQDGQLVWFEPLSPPGDTALRAFNAQVQTYQGKPVLAWFQGAVVEGHGQGHYVLCGPDYQVVKEIKAANGYMGDLHELVLTPQGTALFTCYGQASANLSPYGGARSGAYFYGVAQEVDLATGKLLWQWRSDEHVGLANSYVPAPASSTVPWDYFHINSIWVDPTDGNLVISGRNVWAFFKVERPSGKLLWQAGGKKDQFERGQGAHWAFQHDVRVWPGGALTLFDNEGGPPNQASQSRALVLSMDEGARRISLVHQLLHDPPVMTDALGNVQPLPDGHHFVGWGQSSYFTEYDASAQVVFDGHLASGCESYRAFKQSWTGVPAAKPAMALVPSGDGVDIFVSWNGATTVGWWVVLGGPSPASLTPLGRGRRAGFETQLSLGRSPAYLAVEAMSASGATLSRSRTAKVHG